MKRYSDTRYTELFSHPLFVQRLLENFVEEDFVSQLDFSAMEPYKTKYVTGAYASRESDVIWKIRFKGQDLYLFLLIEFQSTVDRSMPIRLLRYIAEFYADLERKPRAKPGDIPEKAGTPENAKHRAFLYPAIFPIVLYNGSARWTAKPDIADLIEPSIPELYIPRLRYYVIEERMFPAIALLEMRNLVSLLFYAETVNPTELILSIDRFFDILKSEDVGAVKLFSRWLNDYFRQVAKLSIGTADVPDLVDFDPEEARPMLAENLTNWFKKAYEDGMQEGIEKERRDSTRKFSIELLTLGTDIEKVAGIAGMSVAELKELIES